MNREAQDYTDRVHRQTARNLRVWRATCREQSLTVWLLTLLLGLLSLFFLPR